MKYQKAHLLSIVKKIERGWKLSPFEISYFLQFESKKNENKTERLLKQAALPIGLALGFFYAVFSDNFAALAQNMPSWTNLSPSVLSGVDYLWDLLGEPVGRANILYHVPNIIIYSFGVLGVKKLFEVLDKKSWIDRVLTAKEMISENVNNGEINLSLKKGHSMLFVGSGDFIGMQMAIDHPLDETVTISETKPIYTNTWNYYSANTMYEDLKTVLELSDGQDAGEYIFFPVKDDQIFLPGPTSYDLSPYKLDILCQNIRTVEKENKWGRKRIIIVGDKYHNSAVRSADEKKILPQTEDVISLTSIGNKYKGVTILDPTDIVLEKILEIAMGRKIVFRATKEGLAEYKKRFYDRIRKLGYKPKKGKKGILTIGYDLFEEQTEQQMLSRKIDDYFPVVLSKNVHDALIRNGYKKSEFIYVPDLVLTETSKIAREQ